MTVLNSEKHHAPGLLDEPPMLVYPSLAAALGINKAVVFQQLHFLINGQRTAKNKYNFVHERWWVYNSYAEWKRDFFPWLGESTIKGIFTELEKERVILSLQGVKNKSDRRKWYTIDYAAWDTFWLMMSQKMSDEPSAEKCLMDGQKMSDDSSETSSETPKNTSDNSAPNGAGSEPKPRERNFIFDAVAAGHGLDAIGAEGGRIAMIANWLAGTYEGKGARKVGKISAPATVEHIQQFFKDWSIDCPNVNPPMDFVKFVEHWRIWASRRREAAAKPTSRFFKPLNSPSIHDEVPDHVGT